MPEERELKLEFRAGDAAVLKRSALFGAGKDRTSETLRSVYFDTPKHRLAKRGFTLRVRESSKGFVQTLKAKCHSGVGTHVRDEWEWPLPDANPDLSLLDATPLARQAGKPGFKAKLAPVFETKVERTKRLVKRDGAEVELALDEGVVVAGARSAPIRSLELELKSGPVEVLYALARQFPRKASLDLDVRTKSERGYALLGDTPAVSYKADPIDLDAESTAGAAAQVILKSCLRQFRLNVAGILEGGAPEALHQARVAVRRCRSAMSFFKPVLADADFATHAAALKALSHALGDARDLDVFLSPDGPTLPAALRERAAAERAARYATLRASLTGPDHRSQLLELIAWIEHGAWATAEPNEPALPIARFAAARLDAWRRKLRKGGRDLAALDPHHRHQLRLAAKKMRYACEFMATLASGKADDKRLAAFVGSLETLQKDLGALNDRAFGHELQAKLDPDGTLGQRPRSVPDAERAKADVALIASAERAYDAVCACKAFWT